MRPVAPRRPQVMTGEREIVVGEERVGLRVGNLRPLELEEQERRRDRRAALFDELHQRAARGIGRVGAEVEARVVVGPPDEVVELGQLVS